MDPDTVTSTQATAAAIVGQFSDSLDNYADNKQLVKDMEGLLTDIAKLHKSIVPLLMELKAKTDSQGSKMKELLSGITKGKEPKTVETTTTPKAILSKICVAPGMTLPGVVAVDSWKRAPSTTMYYNTRTEEFGIRICGVMLCGKIGELYGQPVQKYIDCRNHAPGDDISKCTFFHDPARYPKSRDRRGFPNKIRYESPSGTRPPNQYNLVAGSLSNLPHDLKFIKPREATKIMHYAFHWLLVSMLAKQAVGR